MVRPIPIAEILSAAELIKDYAAECLNPLVGLINPQPQMYDAMERAGVLKSFGLFDGEMLIGFAIVLLTVLPHTGEKIATVDKIYARRGGRDLRAAIEAYAKEDGCPVIFYSAPAGGRFEQSLSKDQDYKRTNAIFCRSL